MVCGSYFCFHIFLCRVKVLLLLFIPVIMKSLKLDLTFSFALWLFYCISCNSGRKQPLTLGERVQELTEMSSKRAVIKLTGEKFHQFVKATPRNYSFVIMLSALSSQRQCLVCRYVNDEFQLVANSWRYPQIITNKLFFGVVDYDDTPDVFKSLKVNSAPVIMHFPEKGKPKKSDTMDIRKIGFQAETIAKWIGERTDIQIRIFRPPNYSGTIVLVILLALIGALLYMRRNNLDFLYNKNYWGLAALCIVWTMTSGQMWNHIRGPPFMHTSSRGSGYIHGNSSGQFIVETYIVMALNAAIAFGMILLQEAATSREDAKKRKVMAVVGLTIVAVFFSLLLSIFRMKAQGYPYSFLFK